MERFGQNIKIEIFHFYTFILKHLELLFGKSILMIYRYELLFSRKDDI